MRRVAAVIATVAGFVAVAATQTEAAAPVVSFAALPPGWHTFAGTVATSWRYEPGHGMSGGWADHMPKGGIAVSVMFPNARASFGPLRLVLPPKPSVMLEGTKDTPEYRIEGRTRGRNVLVFVDIRSPHPTAAQLSAAQQVVAALRFS